MCIDFHALIIQLVLLCGFVAILQVLIPWLLGLIGFSLGPIPRILWIICGIAIAIFVINLLWALWGCFGGDFGSLSVVHH